MPLSQSEKRSLTRSGLGEPPLHLRDSLALVDALAERYRGRERTTVTWLNHFSAQRVDRSLLEQFDYVGVDGIFLRRLVGGRARSSADMVVPLLLSRLQGARILAIGGTEQAPGSARELRFEQAMDQLCGASTELISRIDGYSGLKRGDGLVAEIERQNCDVVLVGLGAGLQDAVAQEAIHASTARIALTCGGFLDQLVQPDYYPRWAYPLRLNWFVRLAREPRRLWGRYTVDAALAVARRKDLRTLIEDVSGFRAAEALVATSCDKP